MNKLKILACFALCFVGIVSVSTLLVIFLCNRDVTIDNTLFGAMLTGISVIVSMGIGYSIVNVHDYMKKVNELNENFKNFKDEINADIQSKVKELQFNNIVVERKTELNMRNMAAKSFFEQKSYLQALKTEYDTLVFLFENYKFLEKDFNSYIGSKRKFISNDILFCVDTIDLECINNLKQGELNDIVKVILRNIDIIEQSDVMKNVFDEEQIRFRNIFDITSDMVIKLLSNSIPLNINIVLKSKMKIYADDIIFGDKPDDKQC